MEFNNYSCIKVILRFPVTLKALIGSQSFATISVFRYNVPKKRLFFGKKRKNETVKNGQKNGRNCLKISKKRIFGFEYRKKNGQFSPKNQSAHYAKDQDL